MKKFSLNLAIASLFVAFASSCTTRLTDFTVISTKSIPFETMMSDLAKAPNRVTGEDKAHIVLSIPTGSPNLKEAIDKAIESYPGAVALADGVVKSKFLYFFLYGQTSYIVEGTPLYPKNLQQNPVGNLNQPVQVNQPVQQNDPTILVFHDVKKDDTMAEIARTYGCTIADIIRWNQLSSTTLVTGSKLKIYIK